MRTPYEELPDNLYKEFCEVAGYKKVDGEWTVVSDELEYWQLAEGGSTVTERKWKKKPGWLPIRDYNFQYAMYQFPKMTKGAEGKMIRTFNLEKALQYAKEKLFNNGKPVYLPELLAEKADPMRDIDKKPPKSYNQILKEQEEKFKQ